MQHTHFSFEGTEPRGRAPPLHMQAGLSPILSAGAVSIESFELSRWRPPHPASGFLQVVVSKATAADSDEAPKSSSAVASDTTLGLISTYMADCGA